MKESRKAFLRSHKGVALELLINGEQYYPRLWEDIRAARGEVMLESFIVFDDVIGGQLADELCAAARRGVKVHLTIDGWGSAWLPQAYSDRLAESGVHLHIYGPASSATLRLGLRPNLFRRMHRKIVVIDGDIAYIGGINFSEDHLAESHPEGKQDYVVRAVGSVAGHIQEFMTDELERLRGGSGKRWRKFRKRDESLRWARDNGGSEVFFVTRDNREHRSDIERFYKVAFRRAKREIIIANAYFFPSYGFIWQLRRAVRRGVRVALVLQGKPDMEYVRTVASTLYDYLLDAGVELFEYTQRPLHGKVAVFDDWCTIGSSNMDPLSLAANTEANLFIYDRAFTRRLRDHLVELQAVHCRRITREEIPRQRGWRHLVRIIAFHLMRRFPNWLGRQPA